MEVAEWSFASFCADDVWGNTWSWVISGNRKNKEELAVTGSSLEGRKGKVCLGGCLEDSGRCRRWSVSSGVARPTSPGPARFTKWNRWGGGGGWRLFWPISAGPAVWIYKSRGLPQPTPFKWQTCPTYSLSWTQKQRGVGGLAAVWVQCVQELYRLMTFWPVWCYRCFVDSEYVVMQIQMSS